MPGALPFLQAPSPNSDITIDPGIVAGSGGVQPANPNSLMAANGGYDPALWAAATGQGIGASGGNAAPPPNAGILSNLGQRLIGDPSKIPGALSQYQADYNAAAAQKQQQIQNAISILQASGAHAPGATNLPLLMASGAMMSGGTGIGSEISKAALAGGQAIQQQREIERQNALAIGQLGIEGAEVPMQTAEQNLQNFLGIEKLGEEATSAGGQEQVRQAAINAGVQKTAITGYSREQVANIQAGARLSAAQIQAAKGQIKYLGLDPTNPSQGVYLNSTTGSTVYGPAAQSASADSKAYNDALQISRTQSVPFETAFQMARGGFDTSAKYEAAVTAKENMIRQTPQGMGMSADQIADWAREQVLAERGGGAAPAGTPGAAVPPQKSGAAAAPAAHAAPPPAAVQMLKQNPSAAARAQFDQVFGAGAAAKAIGS